MKRVELKRFSFWQTDQ